MKKGQTKNEATSRKKPRQNRQGNISRDSQECQYRGLDGLDDGSLNSQLQDNGISKGQIRDLNNRTVFREPILCAQFLRDYADIELLKDIQPEDIEDVSEKYQAYLGISFETDSVKKIRIRNVETEKDKNVPLYLISLVEHKSNVDYNVSMQLFRYMACIWHEYAKEADAKKEGGSSGKNFRYPPILPIVYYEGAGRWTADFHLKDRIMMNGVFGDYLPDFTYKLVRNHDYTNEELLGKKDEMSLLMMISKVQTPEDMKKFLEAERDKISDIIQTAPKHILEIIVSAIWSLCMKMNVPQEEAEQCVGKVRERQMGYWFESMEKMDIQEERRNTVNARKEAEDAKKEAEDAKKEAEDAKKKAEGAKKEAEDAKKKAEGAKKEAEDAKKEAEDAKKEAEDAKKKAEGAKKEAEDAKKEFEKFRKEAEKIHKEAENSIKTVISFYQDSGSTKESAITNIMEKIGLSREDAEKKVNTYWSE